MSLSEEKKPPPAPFWTAEPDDAERHRHNVHYLETYLGRPFTPGNRVRPLDNGDEIFPAMLKAIRTSRSFIEFLTFIYWTGQIARDIADALSERARAGVSVRVLLDAFGSADINKDLIREMEGAGVEVRWFRKMHRSWVRYDWRTHRKILVCDGVIGFTGGVGIAEEWEGDARNENEWRETHFQVEGPAVHGLRAAFHDEWAEVESSELPPPTLEEPEPSTDGIPLQVIASHSGPRTCNAFKVLLILLSLARERLEIVSPYFVPHHKLCKLLCQRAREGVRVRLLLPGKYTDKRFERLESTRYFERLLEAGIEIHLYQKTMIHTKLLLCDDSFALFGSINFNRRSLGKDEEIGVVAAAPKLVKKLRETFESDIEDARQLDRSQWKGPPWWQRVLHVLMTPFRRQL